MPDFSSGLPVELLAYIFEYVATAYPAGSLRWTPVMLVCRRWHSVAINTPKLWTTIACPECHEDRWVLPLLKRSRDLPLSVRLHRDRTLYTPSYFSRNTFHKLVKVLVQNPADMRRLQSIHIRTDLPHDTFTVEQCLEQFRLPAPALRVFHLDAIDHRAVLSPDLFGGTAPSLREFTLKTRLGLSSTHPLLRNLTCLHLEVAGIAFLWSVEETLAVLAACPSLTSLALASVLDDAPSNSFAYPVDTVTLPLRLFVFHALDKNLRRLTDRLASSRPTVLDGTIIDNRIPNFVSPNFAPVTSNEPLSTLFMSLTSNGDHIIGYPATVDPSLDLRRSAFPSAKDGRYDVRDFDDERYSKISSTDTSSRLFLFDLLFLSSHVDMVELVHSCTRSPTHTVRWLSIKVKKPTSAPAISENNWRYLFESMPQVERLSIRAKDRFMDPLLAALHPRPLSTSDTPRSGSDGASVLFPKLRTLELDQALLDEDVREDREPGTSFLEDGESIRRLLKVLQARQSHSAPTLTLVVEGKEVSQSDIRSLLRVKLD